MKNGTRPECIVPASLAMLLRVSRMAGFAPVELVKKRNEWLVRVFPPLYYYSCLLILTINVLTILAVISDLLVPYERTVRMRTEARCVIWIFDVFLVSLTANVGVYTAPARMACLIDHVNRIQKINSETNFVNMPAHPDIVKYRMVIVSICVTAVIMVADFFDSIYSTAVENRHLIIAAAYSCYYLSYIMLELLEFQFIMTAFYVLSSIKHINLGLSSLLRKRDLDTEVILNKSSRFNYVYSRNTIVPTKHVNKIIDTIAVVSNTYSEMGDKFSRATDDKIIRRLSLAYGSVCGVVRQIDRGYGTILLLLLASFLLHLVVTPYYVITALFDHSAQTLWNKFGKSTIQICWCLFHTINLIILIEPCHRTLIEIDITKELVSNLMCATNTSCEAVFMQLKLFCKRLSMNDIDYAPLKVCTLKRSLIATIFGSITTYLVVIIQL